MAFFLVSALESAFLRNSVETGVNKKLWIETANSVFVSRQASRVCMNISQRYKTRGARCQRMNIPNVGFLTAHVIENNASNAVHGTSSKLLYLPLGAPRPLDFASFFFMRDCKYCRPPIILCTHCYFCLSTCKIWCPPQSLQVLLFLPCVQVMPPPQSLQMLLALPCVLILPPPQSLHWVLFLPCANTGDTTEAFGLHCAAEK